MITAHERPFWLARSRQASTPSRWDSRLSRTIVVLACAAATIAGFTLTGETERVHAVALAGPDLTRLLRAMAAIKGVMAIATVAAIVWRLSAPAGAARLAIYALGCSAMAAGPGLIWSMDHVAMGAALLHGGIAVSIVVLWRDPAMSQLLAAKIKARLGGMCLRGSAHAPIDSAQAPQTPRH
jgi:hypothetical protein